MLRFGIDIRICFFLPLGHYLLLEGFGHKKGQKAQVLSPVFVATGSTSDCKIRIHWYMYGRRPSTMTVSVR